MEWKYVKPLTDDKCIINIEKKYGVEIPKYLKEIVIRYNGGRPIKNIFKTKNGEEKVFKSLLSYNRDDKENIYIFDELFQIGYIPFAVTEFGDILCIKTGKKFVELYLHELNDFEYISENMEEFIKTLYNYT